MCGRGVQETYKAERRIRPAQGMRLADFCDRWLPGAALPWPMELHVEHVVHLYELAERRYAEDSLDQR